MKIPKYYTDHYALPTKEQLELRKRWVKALRSGDYVQAQGALRTGASEPVSKTGPGYCCLGVGCDVSALGKWDAGEGFSNLFSYVIPAGEKEASVLPDTVSKAFGYISPSGFVSTPFVEIGSFSAQGPITVSLIRLNDEYGMSFEQIANLLEQQHILPFEEEPPAKKYLVAERDNQWLHGTKFEPLTLEEAAARARGYAQKATGRTYVVVELKSSVVAEAMPTEYKVNYQTF